MDGDSVPIGRIYVDSIPIVELQRRCRAEREIGIMSPHCRQTASQPQLPLFFAVSAEGSTAICPRNSCQFAQA
jgi:hypothetical protein